MKTLARLIVVTALMLMCSVRAGAEASAAKEEKTESTLKDRAQAVRAETRSPSPAKHTHVIRYQPPPIAPMANPRVTPDRARGRTLIFRPETLTSTSQ